METDSARSHGWKAIVSRLQDLALHKKLVQTITLSLRQRCAAAMHRRGFPPGLEAHPGQFPAVDRLETGPMLSDGGLQPRRFWPRHEASSATDEPESILILRPPGSLLQSSSNGDAGATRKTM
jgi:hypothetical protein